MLISDIRDEIIVEVGGDITDTALAAKVLGFIKSALRWFPRWMKNRMVRSLKTGSLTAAATTMSLPSGIVNIERVYFVDTNGQRQEIARPGMDDFNANYSTVAGYPRRCIIRGSTVEFDRPADQTYSILFEANVEIDGVAAGDTWAYSTDRAEILKHGAKYYYFDYAEDEQKSTEKMTLFKKSLDELEREHDREETPDHVEET